MDRIDNLRIAAATAASRAETSPVGSDLRTDYQWFASKAESLANAIERGVLSDERIETEVAALNDICSLTV
jgi:hypothetical protein